MWNAIFSLFGNIHAQSINNIKWYYDPTTGLFEPIMSDVFLYRSTFEEVELSMDNEMVNAILKSSKVRQSRLKSLNVLAYNEKDFILKTFKDIYSEISPYIHSGVESYNFNLKGVGLKKPSYLHYTHQNRYKIFETNIENLKKSLSNNVLFIETKYNLKKDNNFIKVDIINQGISPIDLQKITISPSDENKFSISNPKVSFLLTNSHGFEKNVIPDVYQFSESKWYFEFKDLILINSKIIECK